MSLVRLQSVAFQGLDPVLVDVEVDTFKAQQSSVFTIVGLPDTAVRESKDRVLLAVANSGTSEHNAGTINLAPGHIRKEGVYYDLPIALGMAAGDGKLSTSKLEGLVIAGELGLGGTIRPVRGILAMAMLTRSHQMRGVIVPAANAAEACAVPDIEVYAVETLQDAIAQLNHGPQSLRRLTVDENLLAAPEVEIDFADIKGQSHVKRAMEIAAAGSHNMLLSGPPGSGKTMLAKALPGIMPALTIDEALEVTKIHSVAGLLPIGVSLVTTRPFRSPHHTVSYAGLIGGGQYPRPGEVSLAHHGILFLDELPEFSRTVLEVLRQPLEDRIVTISRAQGTFTFPTNMLCIAAMNPCPCGYLSHPDRNCSCTDTQIARYRAKISGPLLDRLDMHIEVPALSYSQIADGTAGESSQQVRERVCKARSLQASRQGSSISNALLTSRQLKSFAVLDNAGKQVMRQAIDTLGISVRAHDRILRVARTIADLAGSEMVEREHLLEAVHYRDQHRIPTLSGNHAGSYN